MIPTAQRILQLTQAVAEATAAGDMPRCDDLLTERGEAVRVLSELHQEAGGGEPPAEVRAALAKVRELDGELERTWLELRERADQELARIAGRPKEKHGTEAPCIIDRQA